MPWLRASSVIAARMAAVSAACSKMTSAERTARRCEWLHSAAQKAPASHCSRMSRDCSHGTQLRLATAVTGTYWSGKALHNAPGLSVHVVA